MHAWDRRDVSVEEGLSLSAEQWLGCDAASGEIVRIAWHAYHRDGRISQELLACPIQMVEVSASAMRDQAVCNAL